jgi:protein-glutamine gamma-glutamyltransferase
MTDALTQLPIPRRSLLLVVVVIGLLMAPHVANLHAGILGFFYVTAAWRLLGTRLPQLLPGRLALLSLTLLALALVATTTPLNDGRLAGTALLAVMLGLKLVEVRNRRDMHVAIYLGFFLAMTLYLYDQSLWLAVYSVAGVAALVRVLIGLNRVESNPGRENRAAWWLTIAAIPLAVVVFFLFPRLQAPLWAIDSDAGVTGISDEMSLGTIGDLSQSTRVALRVRFLGREPLPQDRYWRGPVLWETDGQRWTRGLRSTQPVESIRRGFQPVEYEITLEPTGEFWLFGLDTVVEAPPNSFVNRNYSLVGEARVQRRYNYRAVSYTDLVPGELTEQQRLYALQVPQTVSARVAALVAGWRAEAGSDADVVESGLRYFREQPFVYSLTPGTLSGDVIDRFLFDTRRGFCEHYAGSFAVLMRLAGIPSRVVIGYQGGTKNPHADHWVIRQSDAHAWNEVWLDGGWRRVDPTAAVAPERIERPIDPGLSIDANRIVFDGGDLGWIRSVWLDARWMVDAVELGWYRWVIDFTADRQNSLLERFGLSNRHGFGLALALVTASLVTLMAVYLLAQIQRPRQRDRLQAVWSRFTAKLHRGGLTIEPWQGPDTVCAVARKAFPGSRAEITAINRIYVQLRYGREFDPMLLRTLRRRVRQLRL